ncbi:MAG: ferredoxin reductase [Frankiaceae bacterium]|nr:ferredoxin reductase [Frankiaceae bacterium]MBV9869289.1 ferredoxin reductase [Frankiaceae bacterium]
MSVIEQPAATRHPLKARLGRLAELVATPLVPSDFSDLIDPLRSSTDLRGRIVEIRSETADAATIVIKPGRGWRAHTPGQYLRIGVDIDGVRRWRAYSLTSPLDRADGLITITVKAIPDGLVSNFLVRRARPGLVVQLDQPTGDFTLPATAPAKVLFITGGSGITPVMGMLRNAIDSLDDVVLLHSAPTPDDVIFDAELRELAATGALTLIVRHTDTEGMLEAADLEAIVPDLAERETWACGPVGMLDLLEQHWAITELKPLHTERFRPALAAIGEGGTVTFGTTDLTVDADGATPLLDVGEDAGVLMPSGCRMGICFGCVTPLVEGSVRDLRTGEITSAAEGDGVLVQTCISAAAGACTLAR